MQVNDNPLLSSATLPQFATILPEHVEPAIRQVCADLDAALTALEANVEPTWSGLAVPLEQIQDRLGRVWGTVGHLMGVANSPELRMSSANLES